MRIWRRGTDGAGKGRGGVGAEGEWRVAQLPGERRIFNTEDTELGGRSSQRRKRGGDLWWRCFDAGLELSGC
jgi:hypothetical protein